MLRDRDSVLDAGSHHYTLDYLLSILLVTILPNGPSQNCSLQEYAAKQDWIIAVQLKGSAAIANPIHFEHHPDRTRTISSKLVHHSVWTSEVARTCELLSR